MRSRSRFESIGLADATLSRSGYLAFIPPIAPKIELCSCTGRYRAVPNVVAARAVFEPPGQAKEPDLLPERPLTVRTRSFVAYRHRPSVVPEEPRYHLRVQAAQCPALVPVRPAQSSRQIRSSRRCCDDGDETSRRRLGWTWLRWRMPRSRNSELLSIESSSGSECESCGRSKFIMLVSNQPATRGIPNLS